MKKYSIIAIILLLCTTATRAQYRDEALHVIAKLGSRQFAGRGYTRGGHTKAARYITKRLVSYGLQVDIQPFSFPVVVFPGKVRLRVNDTSCTEGTDFVASPSCPAIKGRYGVDIISRGALINATTRDSFLAKARGTFMLVSTLSAADTPRAVVDSSNKILAVLKQSKNTGIAGIMIHNPPVAKWGISQSHAALPVIQVSRAMNDSLVTEVDIDIESQLIEKQESQNIVGMVRGTGSGDSLIVVSAHYDHIGQLGNAVFPGANDNASGVALLLALARHFAQHKPRYDMVFIAFSGEEVGLVGSQYFVNHPTFDLQRISFMLNFDMVGTGINGIKVVNGSNMKRDFAVLKNLNDSLGLVKAVVPRVGGCISDHCHFCKMGVPSFYIHTLGGPVHYHDVHDRPEALPLEEFDNLTKLMIAYLGVLSR